MARPRTHDPLGLPSKPNLVTDPSETAALVAEFKSRVAYVIKNYRAACDFKASGGGYNSSLKTLRSLVGAGGDPARFEVLSIEMQVAIAHLANEVARIRTSDPSATRKPEDVEAAARELADDLQPAQGRPKWDVFRMHVEGLMAIVKESSGLPVMAHRYTDSVYEPQATSQMGQLVIDIAMSMEPTATKTQIVNMIKDARRNHAGKPMRFLTMFPAYGAVVTPH